MAKDTLLYKIDNVSFLSADPSLSLLQKAKALYYTTSIPLVYILLSVS